MNHLKIAEMGTLKTNIKYHMTTLDIFRIFQMDILFSFKFTLDA